MKVGAGDRVVSRMSPGNYTEFMRQKEMKMEKWKKQWDLQVEHITCEL